MSSILDVGAPTYDELQHRRRLVESLLLQNPRKPKSAGDGVKAVAQALVARGLERQASQAEGSGPAPQMPMNMPSDALVPPTIGQVDPYGTDYNAVGARSFSPQGQPMVPRQSPASPGLVPRAIMHNGDAQYLPPAQYEDSPNAYWDAQRMGDGKGRSFYDVGGEYYPMPDTPQSMGMQDAPQVAPQQNQMPYDRKGPIAPAPIDPNFDGRELLMPDRASLQPQNSFQPGAEYRTAQAGQMDPALNSFQTDDAINKRRAESQEMDLRGALSRLNNISDMLKENPDLIDSLTWTGGMKHRALALRDKTGFDFLEISPEQEKYLSDSTVFRQNILRNINRTISDVTGAQMGEQEARRIRAEMPDIDAGPAEFRAKLAAAMDMIRMDAARLQLWKQGGAQGSAADITDQSVRETLQVRGRELYDQFVSNGLSPSEARLKASQALSEEFGI